MSGALFEHSGAMNLNFMNINFKRPHWQQADQSKDMNIKSKEHKTVLVVLRRDGEASWALWRIIHHFWKSSTFFSAIQSITISDMRWRQPFYTFPTQQIVRQ